uniref:FYVE-type domain-containing protein n=1 Tax=Globisporangium ultimum (strain ATCC 200006 / CBS 805.95 / DAOM BR144) TaxID=431595 RepID=K3X125_GLOUD
MSADPFERFPYIRLARREQLRYDHMAADVLRSCLNQYSRLHGVIDTNDWVPVRRRKQMTIFRGLEYSGDPRVTIMTGTGLIHGSLEDVMDGLYCDTHANIRTVTTLLKQKYVDGGVFHVNERRTPDAPFRFAGIKWLAVKAPWGMAKHRDLLTYERMGTTVDADGNELAFHVLQSIERPEWPAGCVKGIKREYTSTCYLYRRHSANRVQCFLWSNVRDLNSIGRRLAEYVTAGALLNVVNTVACAEARKCSKLMIRSNGRACPPSNACHICKKTPGLFDTQRQCAGCKQIVCKSCSAYRPVFKIDSRSGKPMEARFCKLCSNKAHCRHQKNQPL